MAPPKEQYIDILRGIAVLMVVESHTARFVSSGPVVRALSDFGTFGVQLFFVASALTLCLSMQGHAGAGDNLSRRAIYAFYVRRYFRIAPLYYVGIVLYSALSAYYGAAGTPERYSGEYTSANVLANIFLIHGIYAPANNNIVPGGWSIGCEVLFYALFPYLFFRITNRESSRRFVMLAVALNFLIQTIFASILGSSATSKNYPFLFYFIINQLPVFAIGLMLYFSLQPDAKRPHFALPKFVFFFALAALTSQSGSAIPLPYAWTPTLAALSFFYLSHFFAARSPNATSSGYLTRLIASIGRKSYSIYIFHFLFAWNLLGTASILLRLPGMNYPAVALTVLLVCNLAFSYALAVVSGRFIEDVGIALGRRLARRITM